jgi:hypothetical protein
MSAITAILATLCLRPSATDPTPLDVLLKTKAQPQFERPVKSLSPPHLYVFQGFNRGQFPACFLVFTVRSAEGRKLVKAARRNNRRATRCHRERAAHGAPGKCAFDLLG